MKAFRVAWDSNSFQLSPQWPTAKLNFTDEFIQQVSLSCWCSQHIPHLVIVGGCVEAETRDESEWAGHCSFPLVAVETLFKLISHLLSMPLASLSEEWGRTDSFSRWFNLFFSLLASLELWVCVLLLSSLFFRYLKAAHVDDICFRAGDWNSLMVLLGQPFHHAHCGTSREFTYFIWSQRERRRVDGILVENFTSKSSVWLISNWRKSQFFDG